MRVWAPEGISHAHSLTRTLSQTRRLGGMIAVGCKGSDAGGSNIQVFELEESRRWVLALDRTSLMAAAPLPPPSSSSSSPAHPHDFIDDVNDVAFAPSMGRSYFLLAAACMSRGLYLWKITPNTCVNATLALTCIHMHLHLHARKHINPPSPHTAETQRRRGGTVPRCCCVASCPRAGAGCGACRGM